MSFYLEPSTEGCFCVVFCVRDDGGRDPWSVGSSSDPSLDIRRSVGAPLPGLLSRHITPYWLDLGEGGLSRTS